MSNMTIYQVGGSFLPGVQQYPEGAMYVYHYDIHQVLIMFKGILPVEREAFLHGLTRFGLYVEEDVIMLLYKSDLPSGAAGIGWHDIPYTWHLVQEAGRTLPEAPETLPPNRGIVMNLFLIDADTGLINAMRQLNVSHDFTSHLYTAIRAQIETPFNEVRYLHHIDEIHFKFLTPRDVADHAEAKCIGGILEV